MFVTNGRHRTFAIDTLEENFLIKLKLAIRFPVSSNIKWWLSSRPLLSYTVSDLGGLSSFLRTASKGCKYVCMKRGEWKFCLTMFQGGIVSLIRNVFVMGKGEGLAFLLGTFKPYSIFYLLFWE